MDVLGKFDLVTAAYLLVHATSRDQLSAMCQGVVKQLKPGGRLVALTINPQLVPDQLPRVEHYRSRHIPPGAANGWIKIEMLEGLYAGLTHPSTIPRLLWGDFNTPQLERPMGEVVTWGQRINRQGVAVICQYMRGGEGVCWDRGERQVL